MEYPNKQTKIMYTCCSIRKRENESIDVDATNDKDVPHPMRREAAKAEHTGKRKADQILDDISKLGDSVTKIIDLTQECKKDCKKMTESHLWIARDQKEAKWVESYNLFLAKGTSNMPEEEKGGFEKTLQKIEKKLFSTDED
jgi:hypothetical protein